MTGPAGSAGHLVAVAHGTRRRGGNDVAARITALAAGCVGLPGTTAYVELGEPLLADVVAALDAPAAVVPLLLSTGHHVRQDLPSACAGAPARLRLGRPLGPDPALAAAQAERLRQAGAAPGQPVAMVAAGSTDPRGLADLCRAGALLGERWGAEVRLATLGGLGNRPCEVVRPGDAVSPYLLSPGLFSRRCVDEGRAAGATVVADVLGSHPAVVGLVARRARELLAA